MRTTPIHPHSNGHVEHFNGTLATQLAVLMSQCQQDWGELLPLFLSSYRTAVQESTQLNPTALMFSHKLRTPMDLVFGPPPKPELPQMPGMDYYFHLRERLAHVHELA